ncbi:MAG: SEC-C metal-binding domain-containing protein [Desulfopila sp.]|nr:SEC-C metal-binding domain-containing protein [Desulfopila sp.]
MKIGRNDGCPCGSGRKYKRCCADKPLARQKRVQSDAAQEKVTLTGAIQRFQKMAAENLEMMQQVGVFLLYCDKMGDAWVLEITDSDCVQIASSGKPLEVPLEENDETIVVDWSHSFLFHNRQLQITSYRDKSKEILHGAPVQQLFAARRKILKRLPPELLQKVHLE